MSDYHDFGEDGFTYTVTASYPKSRGTLRLRGKNPRLHPIINYQHLEHQYDKDITLAGQSRFLILFHQRNL